MIVAIIGVAEHGGLFNVIDRGIGTWIIERGWGDPGWARAVTVVGSTRPMIVLTIVAATTLAVLGDRRIRSSVWLLIVATPALATVATAIGKHAIQRQRPNLIPDGVQVGGWSWPSGHASGTMALALAMVWVLTMIEPAPTLMRRIVAACAVLAAMSVALTRVLLDVHWASDVVSGWCVAVAAVMTMAGIVPIAARRQ